MTTSAKRAAIANLIINFLGVLFFLPWTTQLLALARMSAESPAQIVANAHLIFNFSIVLVSLPLISPLATLVTHIIKTPMEVSVGPKI
jgi:phosphate:Na+ symporter